MLKKLRLVTMLVAAIALILTVYQPAEAANPIKPSQSRVTHYLKDANGLSYKVYFAGTNEKQAIASINRSDWAKVDESDRADQFDKVYMGNYTLYTQSTKSSHIMKSNFSFPNYFLNITRKNVHIYPSTVKGQPDYLGVAYAAGDFLEFADWYYMHNGQLRKVMDSKTFMYSKRPKTMGKNTFLSFVYDPTNDDISFMKFGINPAKGTVSKTFPKYSNPREIINRWPQEWK